METKGSAQVSLEGGAIAQALQQAGRQRKPRQNPAQILSLGRQHPPLLGMLLPLDVALESTAEQKSIDEVDIQPSLGTERSQTLHRLLALQQVHKLSLFTGELKQVEHSRALENFYTEYSNSIPTRDLAATGPTGRVRGLGRDICLVGIPSDYYQSSTVSMGQN